VNYHLEHHLIMTVPHYHLRRMHRLLRERGGLDQALVSVGYPTILKAASAKAS
jgi:fatty acid desaturase